MKYNDFSLGQIEAVFNKLGGIHGIHRFLRGDTIVQAKPREFKIWRSIKVGNYQQDSLIDEVIFGGKFEQTENLPINKDVYGINRLCIEMLHSNFFKTYPTECEIDLVVVSPSQLGFSDRTPAEEIYSWAKQLGLELCLPEVGIQLCLQLENQPSFGLVTIAMKPIFLEGIDRFPFIYKLRMNNGQRLYCDSGKYLLGETCLVFQLSRKNG
jgi:hypothetical protein